MMATTERTPLEEADRQLGKAINLSSDGNRGEAALSVEKALEVMPDLPENARSHIQAAKDVEGWEFRTHLREARQFLVLEADE